jgi:hypothetical protein
MPTLLIERKSVFAIITRATCRGRGGDSLCDLAPHLPVAFVDDAMRIPRRPLPPFETDKIHARVRPLTSSDIAAIVSIFFVAELFFSRIFFALKIRDQPY